ncbi:Dr1-associated corepressor [Enteropsectra breve]|nr:Dr1-associated corepressor [Enteropsectra breve]
MGEEGLTDLQRKKKTRFPISRIKKLMQQNEDIGKTTGTVPVVLSKAVELFAIEFIGLLAEDAIKNDAQRVQDVQIKNVITGGESKYKFLAPLFNEEG